MVSLFTGKGEKAMWNRKRKLLFLLFLAVIILFGILIPIWCYHFDNKYTYPRPAAEQGVINLDMDWYEREPFFYLVDGWEFYHGRTLVRGQLPDEILYIGRYGGFDLGDPEADPHGSAIYRLLIVTDSKEREYALELTQIYSKWNVWINGQLMESTGLDTSQARAVDSGGWNPFIVPEPGEMPEPDSNMITFRARDRIEIVVAVEDDSHFYSGMVYPPAFGSPRRVGAVLSARLLIHGGTMMAATAMAVLCTFLGFGCHFRRPYGAVALLCLCVAGSTSWPVCQALNLTGDIWYLLERFCYYGIFLLAIWIQGRICILPKKVIWPACAAGILVQLSILVQPMIPVSRAAVLMDYSALLASYKWLTAVWLIATSVWSLYQGVQYARPMMGGSCILACALIMGKLLPVHEPVYMGWFVELAGVALLLLVAGILWYDTVLVYKESVELHSRQEMAQIQLLARAEQAAFQQEYVRRTRKLLHESRHRLTLIRHYLDNGELDQLSDYLQRLTLAMGHLDSREYTTNTLIDAILSTQLSRADQLGIYVELDLDNLPPKLPVTDDDLTLLLMNLLDNAEESCGRLPLEDRWINLKIEKQGARLEIMCTNASVVSTRSEETGSKTERITSKPDKLAHGFGLARIREVAKRYGGSVEVENSDDSFQVTVALVLPGAEAAVNCYKDMEKNSIND